MRGDGHFLVGGPTSLGIWGIAFGAGAVNVPGSNFLFPYNEAGGASTLEGVITYPFAGILSMLQIVHRNTNGADLITYAIRLNGVVTALSAQLNTGALGPANNLVTQIPYAAGDRIGMSALGATGSRACGPLATLLFTRTS